MSNTDWNGMWLTRWVTPANTFGSGPMTVTIAGETFSGSWGAGTSLQGTIANDLVQGTWTSSNGTTDTFWFVLGPDRRSFAGLFRNGSYSGPWWGSKT